LEFLLLKSDDFGPFFSMKKSFEHIEKSYFSMSKFGENVPIKKALTNTHHHIMQDG